MNSTEITIYFEEAKAAALKAVLAQEGSTIESKLQESLRFLYEQLVPVEQQSAIDALIKAQEEQERQEAEARKRFAVFHVRENGENSYFTSQHFTSFHAAGYRYRLYARGDLSSQPQNLADAFAGSEAISEDQYRVMKEQMPDDHRILALIDFDLDEGTVSACKLGHREMSPDALNTTKPKWGLKSPKERMNYGCNKDTKENRYPHRAKAILHCR